VNRQAQTGEPATQSETYIDAKSSTVLTANCRYSYSFEQMLTERLSHLLTHRK